MASSPGSRRRTEVWISREVIVDLRRDQLQRLKTYNCSTSSPLVILSQLAGLSGNPLEEVVDETVHDGHSLGGDTGVGVDLLQYLETRLLRSTKQ